MCLSIIVPDVNLSIPILGGFCCGAVCISLALVPWFWSLNLAARGRTLIFCLSSIGCRSVTVSIADVGVLRMAPDIILMGWCFTLDSLLEFNFAAVELAAVP